MTLIALALGEAQAIAVGFSDESAHHLLRPPTASTWISEGTISPRFVVFVNFELDDGLARAHPLLRLRTAPDRRVLARLGRANVTLRVGTDRRDSLTSTMVDRIRESLEGFASERFYFLGGQAYVEQAGSVLFDEGFGVGFDGQPVEPGHLHNIYCASKPLLALSVGLLCDRAELSLDAPLERWIGPAWAGKIAERTTLVDLLNHRVGLDGPTAADWRMVDPRYRADLLARTGTSPRNAYSEITAGLVIEDVVHRASGRTLVDIITHDILGPLGVRDDFIVDPALAAQDSVLGRVLVPVAGLPSEVIPLLSELLPSECSQVRPAFGALASISALGRLYTSIRICMLGTEVPGLPSESTLKDMLSRTRVGEWDDHLQRRCDFAGGFMTNFDSTRLCLGLSDSAVGHVAGVACSIGFFDASANVAAAMYVNGCLTSADDLDHVRSQVVARMLAPLQH
jgi:CubicO group peptidase (beta-lactamase class C family)